MLRFVWIFVHTLYPCTFHFVFANKGKQNVEYHFNSHPQLHDECLKVLVKWRNEVMSQLVAKSDIAYSIIIRGWNDKDYEELIKLRLHEKWRSGCTSKNCNNVGDYNLTSVAAKKWYLIYRKVCKRVITMHVIPSAKVDDVINIVFIGCSFDGMKFGMLYVTF